MSTRSIVLVKKADSNKKITVHRLYKHWDGYPTDNLNMIAKALKTLDKTNVLRDFIKACEVYYDRFGMVEETFHNETFEPVMLGNQSDLEWIYTVDLDAKQIKVFGGGYTGKLPQVAYNKGTVNPLSYVDRLTKPYQKVERQRIQSSITAIKSLGFKIN